MTWRSFLGIAEPQAQFSVDVPPEMMEAMTANFQIAPRISRKEALQVPAVLRARNLICGTLAHLPVHLIDKDNNDTPSSLLEQIDPDVPNVVTLANTYEDMFFEGTAWWKVTAFDWRGFPAYAQHVDPSRVGVYGWTPPLNGSSPGAVPGPTGIYIDGRPVSDNEVIRFDSPNPPLLVHAARAIRTCLTLDRAASRYADEPLPLGYFTPKEGMRPQEDPAKIQALLDTWESMRANRAWAYVGYAWDAETLQFNAEQIQLAEQRQHAVLEIARAAGVDPEDLGVSTTSRTYQNAEQRRQDLIDFTMAPYMGAFEQRMSMRDVTPRGYFVKVNLDAFLRSDTLTRMQAYKVGLDVGAVTHSEIRALENRPPLKPSEVPAIQPTQPVQPTNGQKMPMEVK